MKQLKTILNTHLYFLLFLGFSSILRFSSNVPTLFVADSPKYFVPLQIIYERNFGWLLSSINFGLFNRIINYFIQVNHSGDVSEVIAINKICGIASTILIYWIVYRANSNRMLALIASVIFSLNPALIYMEQIVMPEAFHVFFLLLTIKLLQEIFCTSSTNLFWICATVSGLAAGLSSLTKPISDLWILLLTIIIGSYGLYLFAKTKSSKFILAAIVFYFSSYMVKLPICFYNYSQSQIFDVSTNDAARSGTGVLLWALTEDMVYSRAQTRHPWLTELLVNTTEQFKKEFSVNDSNSVTSPFYIAVSRTSVAGREGRIIHPYTQVQIAPKEWSKICSEYFLDLSISQPLKTLRRIFRISMVNMFAKEDLGLFLYETSIRPNVGFNPIQFTMAPFSLVSNLEPQLINLQASVVHIERSQLSKVHDFFSYFKMGSSDKYLVMVNMDSPYGFWYDIKGLSPWWQRLFAFTPWIWLIFPAFIFALMFYIVDVCKTRRFEIFEFIVLISALYFAFFPILITMCEPRYRLQFIHFMIIFILMTIARYRTLKSPRLP